MKSIEERAKEYANVGATLFMDSPEEEMIYRDDLARAYAAGARAEREELTRWHDPKKVVPTETKQVLICVSPKVYYVALYSSEFTRWFTGNGSYGLYEIIGWREIHE